MRSHVGADGSASPFALGTLLGDKFQIQSVLGQGAVGIVFKALQVSINRPVAIKVLLDSKLGSKTARERFQREALLVARVAHPNVVTMIDADVSPEGIAYLVFEYLSGRPLSAERGKAMEVERAVKIARQVARALSAAHRSGIVHRDLKPGNIHLVDLGGNELDFVKLLDFGIAKLLGNQNNAPPLTAANQVLGTLRYMSPEQIQGRELDARSDLYSLGCILFQLLTGQPPFLAAIGPELIEQHLSERPPRFQDVRPDLSIDPSLEAIVQILLAKRPEDRLQDAETVESMLAEWAPRADISSSVARAEMPESPLAGVTRSELISSLSRPAAANGEDRLESCVPIAVSGNFGEAERERERDLAAYVRANEQGVVSVRALPRSLWIAAPFLLAAGAATVLAAKSLQTNTENAGIVVAPVAQAEPRRSVFPEPFEGAAPRETSSLVNASGFEQVVKDHPKTQPRIRIQSINVVTGPMDHERATLALEAREDELIRCYTRTQPPALATRTLRLHFASSKGRQTMHVDPRDAAAEAFLACTRALKPPIELEKSSTAAIAIISADIGPQKRDAP